MKTQIRHNYLSIRNSLSQDYVDRCGAEILKLFINSGYADIPKDKSIMLYSSFKNETDTWSLINYFYNKRIKVILPKTSNNNIIPYEYAGMDSLKKDSFGILSPDEKICTPADISDIHTVLVPGVVFSYDGNRIGFGKGYYDRFLPKLPHSLKIGLCYEFQIAPFIPADSFDIPMDLILTEKGFINCRK